MKRFRRLLLRLQGVFTPDRRDDLAAELESHIELMAEDHVRGGTPPAEARRQAILRLGGAQAIMEGLHDQRVLPRLDTIVRDVRLTMRRLVREPSLALVCIVTLALGIGATTAIFSAVHAALLRPLPYPAADRLVQVWETNPRAERWGDWASYPDFEDWSREAQAFEGLGLFRSARLRLTRGDYPEMLVAVRVSPGLFPTLGVEPALGRWFVADEGQPGHGDVAILSHALWQRQFGGDATIVGRAIPLDGRDHLVVGVMPARFDFPANVQGSSKPPDVWIPVEPDTARGSHNYRVVGRLKATRTIAQARDDMARVVRAIGDVDPGHRGRGAAVEGLQQHAVAAVRSSLLLLMGAVVVVLLVTCANVSGLLLARGAARQREVALRLALGAARARVFQQAAIDGLILGGLGAGAGILVAVAGLRLLAEAAPALPLVKEARLDAWVLGFTGVAALATGVLCSILPTVQALGVEAGAALKEGGARQAGGTRLSALRTALTVAEVAAALVLLVGAALFLRSFVNVRNVAPGFSPTGIITASLAASPLETAEPSRVAQFADRALDRLEGTPGIDAVAAASAVPLISNETSPFRVEGVDTTNGQAAPSAEQPKVTPAYFRVMRIDLLRGRLFDETDVAAGEPVAIVSKGLADRYWTASDAVGRRIAITDGVWRRIVGIVPDVRNDGLESPSRPTIYIPFDQFPRSSFSLVVRTSGRPAALVSEMRAAVRDVAPTQPLASVQTMEQVLRESMALRRFLALLIGAFAGIAVLLGCVGVYSVLAYLVGQRHREIAIRIALGATRNEIIGMIARSGLRLGVFGVTIGMVAAIALSRVLEGTLFGVSPLDPLTYAVVAGLLLVVVAAATSLPARRASRVAAMAAFRSE